MKEVSKCYMCDREAVSVEHVPPKCLFPEKKEVGEDYRKNLIIVPSCEIHNSAKSKEDEFLMVSLAGIFGNNSIGFQHKLTKVNRAIKRSSDKLLNKAFKKRKHYTLEKDNKFLEIIWGTQDYERLLNSFEHIAYGLHYYHFKKRYKGEIKIIIGYLHSEDKYHNNLVQLIKDTSCIELKDKEKFGCNKDVFYYQFSDVDIHGIYSMRMIFYGGIDIYVAFSEAGKSLDIPHKKLFELSSHFIVKTGDKEYELK